MKQRLLITSIGLTLTLLCSPVHSLQSDTEQKADSEYIERIAVYGEKSLYQLRKDIQKKTRAFFKDYNNLNDNNQFAMVCKKERNTGSTFKSTVCEPRFVRSNRSQLVATRVFGGDTASLSGAQLTSDDGSVSFTSATSLSRLALVSSAGRLVASQDEKFSEHVTKLLKENPQLLEKYNEIIDIQAAFAQKKADK